MPTAIPGPAPGAEQQPQLGAAAEASADHPSGSRPGRSTARSRLPVAPAHPATSRQTLVTPGSDGGHRLGRNPAGARAGVTNHRIRTRQKDHPCTRRRSARELAILLRISRELDIVGDVSAAVEDPPAARLGSNPDPPTIAAWRGQDSGHRYLQVTAVHHRPPVHGRVTAVLPCEQHSAFWQGTRPRPDKPGETRSLTAANFPRPGHGCRSPHPNGVGRARPIGAKSTLELWLWLPPWPPGPIPGLTGRSLVRPPS